MSSSTTGPSGGDPNYTCTCNPTTHHEPSCPKMWNLVRSNPRNENPVSYIGLISLNGSLDLPGRADLPAYKPRSDSVVVHVGSDKEDEQDPDKALIRGVCKKGNPEHQTAVARAGQASTQPARFDANRDHDLSNVGCWAENKASPTDASDLDGAHLEVRLTQRRSQQRPGTSAAPESKGGAVGTGTFEQWS